MEESQNFKLRRGLENNQFISYFKDKEIEPQRGCVILSSMACQWQDCKRA